ncbi:Bug family tripartite tricarboxylate transporter substrate binding protein [Ottowia thiooxydans]|uniref:Bug family tripartite tricarboxylate transporter substrate binding protein n=1 Tax=Ottowia thiooxydans TaxID=219182 RepID=UPI0003F92FD9|nr:tripartite tricarboxylate transporter substrate binding protein [Ottowia thiooxydans]
MKTTRRQVLGFGAAVATLASSSALWAQTLSQKPVTLIVGFPPGGNIDTVARSLSIPLAKLLGTTVLVDYKAGAGGAIGATHVSKSAPDGHTLLVGIPEQVTTLPHMFKTSYKLSNFQPLSLASRTSLVMVARKADTRFKTYEDVVAYAKAKPGALNVGHAGPGTTNHLGILQFEDATKLKLNTIAYKGAAPAIVDLIGGQVDVVFDQVTTSMPHIKAGALQPLAVMGTRPDPALPGVPTIRQLGLKEFDSTTYVGVLAPAGTPAPLVALLTKAIQQALTDEKMGATLRDLGSSVYGGEADEFNRILRTGDALAATMVQEARLRSE